MILSLDRLESQGRQEVVQAAQAGRTSRLLHEKATTLERVARQHIILDDTALLDEYARLRDEFRQTTRQLAALPLEPGSQRALEALADRESRLHKLLVAPRRPPDAAAELAEGYAQLVDGAQAMLAASSQLTQRAIERLQDTATQGREKWIYVGLATVGIAIALAILFATLIARPIRQLDLAIRQMGSADFTHAITVTGPQDLRYVGQRLEWLRGRLSELEEQQARFLRHVSHELKTPLTAVREGAELLRDDVGGKLTPEQRDIVRIVRDNTLSLQKLIENLLAYQQTRAMEPAALGPVQMPDIVNRVLREQRLAALGRMITFETNLAAATVIGDPEKLRTITDNLLSNAIKYSPRNATIRLRVAAQNGFAVVDVIDEGRGVSDTDRVRIFESFYQGQPPIDGRIKGSGLGLAIARDYALAHGGRIEVAARPDGRSGAWFRLSLPLATVEAARKLAPARAAALAGK